jgi:membrane-associated phospholipid phosphatase
MKSVVFYFEETIENLFAINYTPMIHAFEGNSVFWVQHSLYHPAMTFLMAVVYIGSFLFIMTFSLALFAYLDRMKAASKLIFLYVVLFFLTVPFYLLVIVYTPSYPKMFYPGAESIIRGMEPLLYNYGPNVNNFFINYDTFNNCFPSMHIGYPAATIFFLFLNVRGFRRYKLFLIAALGFIAVAIVYLGIHWLTDIVGGFLIAILGVLITERYAHGFWKWVYEKDKKLKQWMASRQKPADSE